MSARAELSAAELPAPGGRALLRRGGRCLVLFNVEGRYHAIDDSCPHQGAALSGGKLDGRVLQCPAHGLRFDLGTGCLLNSAAVRLAVYPIDIEQGRVFVILPAEEIAP
jgi:nitrite reductase/ring-hydroxylating ferredoxin subunit